MMKSVMLSGVVLLCSAFAACSTDPPVNGRVLTEAGTPVKQASVDSQYQLPDGSSRRSWATTDANGKFHLDAARDVVFVTHDGYLPLAHVLRPDQSDLVLVIKAETPENYLRFPACSATLRKDLAAKSGPQRVGIGRLVATIPQRLEEKRLPGSVDVGRIQFSLSAKPSDNFTHWYGIGVETFPFPEYFLQSASWETRKIVDTSGVFDIVEWQGALKSGKKWRWIGASHLPSKRFIPWRDSVWYFDVSDEAAAYFDSIFDHACENKRR